MDETDEHVFERDGEATIDEAIVKSVPSNFDGYWSSWGLCYALKQVFATRIGTKMTIMAGRNIILDISHIQC